MEHLRELMDNAAKLETLELQLPELEARHRELKEAAADKKLERDWAVINAKNLEDPNFFQRLFTKVAEKQEKAQAEAREAAAEYEKVKRELDTLEHQLTVLQGECSALSCSREAYRRAREKFLTAADAEEERHLREVETDVFRPAAVEAVRQIRKSLYAARGWMEKDFRPRYGTVVGRRMEFLHLADGYAEVLQRLIVYFPEGSVTLGASMSEPSSYIHSVSTNLSQIDLLNIAMEQSQRVQAQLEAL